MAQPEVLAHHQRGGEFRADHRRDGRPRAAARRGRGAGSVAFHPRQADVVHGVERFDSKTSNFELFAILVAAQKRILIDSCLQHAAAAFNLQSTVFWIGTSSNVFGYSLHQNIQAKLPKRANQLIGSYLFDYQFENNTHECPYVDLSDIFDIDSILQDV